MKVLPESRIIELTRRNLESLLAKLDGHPPDSFCQLELDGWTVRAVENAEHYILRHPEVVHPATMSAMREGTSNATSH